MGVAVGVILNVVLALSVLGLGWWIGAGWILLTGAVLRAHVGMDRALAYGLKLPSGFRDTHLGTDRAGLTREADRRRAGEAGRRSHRSVEGRTSTLTLPIRGIGVACRTARNAGRLSQRAGQSAHRGPAHIWFHA